VPIAGETDWSATDVTRKGLVAATGGAESWDVSLTVAPELGTIASRVAVAVIQVP
jgi:hypothetical protein